MLTAVQSHDQTAMLGNVFCWQNERFLDLSVSRSSVRTAKCEAIMEEGQSYLEELPRALLPEILGKLDLQSLCCAASVSRTMRLSALPLLRSLSLLDLSGFSPSAEIVESVLRDNKTIKSLTLDCRRLDDSMISMFLKDHLQELVLLKCTRITSSAFAAIGGNCPNLRVLSLEVLRFPDLEFLAPFRENFDFMLSCCSSLESLSIKLPEMDSHPQTFRSINTVLPMTIKALQLRSLLLYRQEIQELIPSLVNFKLEVLSLTIDEMSDEMLISITHNCPLLVQLDLEDMFWHPSSIHDLTNTGLLSLGYCTNLAHLSLVRRSTSHTSHRATFQKVTDIGFFLLCEGCKKLKSLKLGGFSRVTDAGFASILHSCKGLEKFEIVNAFYLSDLTFHDLIETSCSLVNVRLASCSLITSETPEKLSLCKNLEVLNLGNCKSVADQGVRPVSSLTNLTSLDLGGADVTDTGMLILGAGKSPIVSLSLRGCKRVTDRGIEFLVPRGGIMCKTLSSLDLSYMPAISDKAIITLVQAGLGITDLSLRSCFCVTDTLLVVLATKNESGKRSRPLRRLDLCSCPQLTLTTFELLKRSVCRGLWWLGVGNTHLVDVGASDISQSLTICHNGCEMSCFDEC